MTRHPVPELACISPAVAGNVPDDSPRLALIVMHGVNKIQDLDKVRRPCLMPGTDGILRSLTGSPLHPSFPGIEHLKNISAKRRKAREERRLDDRGSQNEGQHNANDARHPDVVNKSSLMMTEIDLDRQSVQANAFYYFSGSRDARGDCVTDLSTWTQRMPLILGRRQ